MTTKQFHKSMERFTNLDGDNFGGCLNEGIVGDNFIEFRVRKSDKQLCVIQYFSSGKGYQIYQPEPGTTTV